MFHSLKSTHNTKGGETERKSHTDENTGYKVSFHSVQFPKSLRNVKPFHS